MLLFIFITLWYLRNKKYIIYDYCLTAEHKYSISRENNHSFTIGAISEDLFVRGEKRSLISLQMCFMGWLYEVLAIVAGLLGALIGYQMQEFNIPNIHFPDAILMFVLIPFIHLLNDEDTKGIIFEEGWIQGIKYVLGIYSYHLLGEDAESRRAMENPRRVNNMSPSASSPAIANFTTSQRRIIQRKCKSATNISLKDVFLLPKEKIHLERRYSLRKDAFPASSGLTKDEKKLEWKQTLARRDSTKIAKNDNQRNILTQSCHSSLSIIYLDD